MLTRWFDLYNECLNFFLILEPDFYTKLYRMNTEGQEMEPHEIFLFPMGNTKITEGLDLQARNDPVKPNSTKEKARYNSDDKKLIKD